MSEPVLMPIGDKISWHNERFVMPDFCEQMAQRNHYQSLERLAERGGLSWREAAAISEGRKVRDMPEDGCEAIVRGSFTSEKDDAA